MEPARVSTDELREAVRCLREHLAKELGTTKPSTALICSSSGVDSKAADDESPSSSSGGSSCEHHSSLAPTNCFQPRQDCTVQHATIEYPTGDVYRGDVLRGTLRHGTGRHECSNGDVYEGQWAEDKRSGRGAFTRTNGFCYTGDWVDDAAEGWVPVGRSCRSGRSIYPEGHKYDGDWVAGRRCGWGSFATALGDQYEGEWDADVVHGQGRWTFADGSYYEGRYEQGERVEGTFVSAGGKTTYTGSFQGQQQHGDGVLVVPGLYRFRGTWVRGTREGFGECQYMDGSRYQGAWHHDQRHGRGVLTSPGGLRYDGEWQDDRQHGQGRCMYANGDRYEGGWAKGVREGRGRIAYHDGVKYQGDWVNDRRCGQGVAILANGDKYMGEWLDDKRHGRGCATFSDGTQFRGSWESDCWLQSEADPVLSRLAGAGLRRAVAGQPASVMIEVGQAATILIEVKQQARDEHRNQRLTGGDAFRLRLCWRGDGLAGSTSGDCTAAAATALVAAATEDAVPDVVGTVTDLGDGTYRGSYTAHVAGTYELQVTTGPADEPVAESPYFIRVSAGRVCVRRSTASGSGCSTAVVGEATTFAVEARDAFGNVCEAGCLPQDLPLTVLLTHSGGEVAVTTLVAADSGSRYLCTYTPPVAGLYRLQLYCSSAGTHLRNSPMSVKVEDGEGRVPQPGVVADRMQGWLRLALQCDSDDEERQAKDSAEEAYIRAHPEVAVVEQLEDIWKVGKLRREREQDK